MKRRPSSLPASYALTAENMECLIAPDVMCGQGPIVEDEFSVSKISAGGHLKNLFFLPRHVAVHPPAQGGSFLIVGTNKTLNASVKATTKVYAG